MPRSKNQALVYVRRSTEKQEISLPAQIEWAVAAARQQDVALDAAVADLEFMQAKRLHRYKAIRLDDGITGADMNRPGFLAVNRDILADQTISHLFIYKRDRFARPADALPMVMVEKKLLEAGVTLVLSDGVSLPFLAGQQDIGRDIGLLFGYYQGGEEIRKHAERVLGFQKKLAEGGYRTGGNPPYGFARVLVDGVGNILEKLHPGKTVHQAGCHVRVVPDDLEKIGVWLQMLEWKMLGWGHKRIAKHLNDLGVPSPNAGYLRTDQGVEHRVSGKWNHNTVGELCRNPIIMGLQQYGKRSEGSLRRLGPDGPRLLGDRDRAADGQPRIIFNDESVQIVKRVGEAQFDPAKWEAVQQQTKKRGFNQRGLARVKDPARYPLACRVVDMTDGCGSILYARTSQGRPLYTCGRYMRTAAAECNNNNIDAEALLRFTLKTLNQLVAQNGKRDKLRALLLDRAHRAAGRPDARPAAAELKRVQEQQSVLQEDQKIIEYRMAREKDGALYAALCRQHETVRSQVAENRLLITQLEAEQAASATRTPEQEVEAALSLFDDVTRITGDPRARAEVNPLLGRLGIWIGLRFADAIKGKKRVVRRLQSGVMTFGGRPPVPLHGQDNLDFGPGGRQRPSATPDRDTHGPNEHERKTAGGLKAPAAQSDVFRGKDRVEKQQTGEGQGCPSPVTDGLCGFDRPSESQPEGISSTKVSRGERI